MSCKLNSVASSPHLHLNEEHLLTIPVPWQDRIAALKPGLRWQVLDGCGMGHMFLVHTLIRI